MPPSPVAYVPRPYVRSGTLGDLLRLRGRNAADAELRRGDISAQMWSNLGNQISAGLTGYARERQEAPIRAQEAEARGLQIQAARDAASERQREREDRSTLQSAMSSRLPPDQVKAQLAELGRGDLVPVFEKTWTDLESARTNLTAKKRELEEQEADYFGAMAAGIRKAGYDPMAIEWALSEAAADGYEVDQYRQMLQQQPDQFRGIVDTLIERSPTQRRLFGEEAGRELKTRALDESIASRAADDARQAEALQESMRHNRVTEGIAQQQANTAAARVTNTGLSADMSPAYMTALDRSILNLPGTRRGPIVNLANRLWAAGDEEGLKDVIRQAAVDTENVDTKNQVMGRMATLASLRDTRDILQEMQAAGVPTNIMRGTVEDVARRLGTSTNPQYVQLANRLMGTLINYRRAATGVAFSARESADYSRMFPNYKNTLPVNLALIDGLEREMTTYDREYWTHKLGPEGAALIGVGQVSDESPHTSGATMTPNLSGLGEGKLRRFTQGPFAGQEWTIVNGQAERVK